MRRGLKYAVFPSRNPCYRGSELTPQQVEFMEGKNDEEQGNLTSQVIQAFRDSEPQGQRQTWIEQAERGWRDWAENLFVMPGGIPTNAEYPMDASHYAFPSYLEAVPGLQQVPPGVMMSRCKINAHFANQFGETRPISREDETFVDENAREQAKYYGGGEYSSSAGDQANGRPNRRRQCRQKRNTNMRAL